MKNLLLVLILFTSSLSHTAPLRRGHVVGNGGGVICIAGVCKTLIDAGLQLSPEFDGVWIPDAAQVAGVQSRLSLATRLPQQEIKDTFSRVFGNLDQFRKVDVVDPAKLAAIRQQYLDLAAQLGFPIDPGTFQVVAFSSDDTVSPALTYLLPDFFNLTPEVQSKILLHEGLYRGRPSDDLKFVLEFESSLSRFQNECLGTSVSVCNDQAMLLYHFGIVNKARLIGMLFANSIISNRQSQLNFTAPGKSQVTSDLSTAKLLINHESLLEMGSNDPRLAYVFSKVNEVSFARQVGGDPYYCSGDNLTVDYRTADVEFGAFTSPGVCSPFNLNNTDDIDLQLPE